MSQPHPTLSSVTNHRWTACQAGLHCAVSLLPSTFSPPIAITVFPTVRGLRRIGVPLGSEGADRSMSPGKDPAGSHRIYIDMAPRCFTQLQ